MQKKIRIFISLVLFLFFSSNPALAIFGGVETNAVMQNSLVNVVLKNGTCSGVLIAKNVVLTAAHCKDIMGDPLKVVLLSEDESSKHCNISSVTDYTYAPNAAAIFPRKVHAPDLIILKLKSQLCSGVPAVIGTDALIPGDILEVTGYGGGSGLWYNSRQISMKIVSSKNISELTTAKRPYFTKLLEKSSDFYLYAVPELKNTTACTGDSGGPLFVSKEGQMYLYAIMGAVFPNKFLGADKCNNGYLHLIAPVKPYLNWIYSQIEEWSIR